MPARTEVLRDGTIGGEEPLGVARGLKPLHVLFPLTGGLMGVLGTVVQIPMLAIVRHISSMCHLSPGRGRRRRS